MNKEDYATLIKDHGRAKAGYSGILTYVGVNEVSINIIYDDQCNRMPAIPLLLINRSDVTSGSPCT